jgi:hypothetical protein
MTQIKESIAIIVPPSEGEECLFSHKKQEIKPRKNVFPPAGGENDAKLLGKNMKTDHISVPRKIVVSGKEEILKNSPHHLIPGDESWPKTDLRVWVDKKFGKIKENIGYDVNAKENGVSLPGWTGYDDNGEKWSNYDSQQEYAFAAMKMAKGQFHDRHATYSKFVVKCLNKIAERFNRRTGKVVTPGCGNSNCMGKEKDGKKHNPPYELIPRLHSVEDRLRNLLKGGRKNWKMPIFTSRWALVYKKDIEAQEAREQLRAASADLSES